MFDGKYLDLNQKRIKGILDFYSQKFWFYKKVCDLGAAHADVSGVLHRLGADITAIDARQEHLNVAKKKYPGIKTLKSDLDRGWPLANQKFDFILDIDLICHLKDYESHLREVCKAATHLIIETAVCDSDEIKSVPNPVNKSIYDQSVNGMGNFPTAAAIEKILTEFKMSFRRQDDAKYNAGGYVYDWVSKNNDKCDINQRRLWFAVKHTSPIQFADNKRNVNTSQIINVGNPIVPIPGPQPPSQVHFNKLKGNARWASPAPKPSNVVESTSKLGKKKFVIVIPSYKNSQWCEKNIQSAINQNYDNYRVMFIDDKSPDDTFEKVSQLVRDSSKSDKFILHKNKERVGALQNLHKMIYDCDDDEIVLTLDGDDWLANDNVLNYLNGIYSDENIWMTYGQYRNYPDGQLGVSKPIPQNIINNNSFRQYDWCSSHLRTFYAWLFKQIKIEDLKYDGKFMASAWDGTMMYPQLEMAGNHSKYINEVLYIYNLENPINDHKVDVSLQQWFDHYNRTMPKYNKINKPAMNKKKIGLLLIATGKYDRFLQGLISSADNFFLTGNYDVTYYIFGDKSPTVSTNRKVIHIPIEHKGFPYATLDRYKHFTNNSEKLKSENYLYYVDVDCLFIDHVGQEILGDLVGVRHCGFINKQGTYEDKPNSVFYADPSRYKYYFGGGFQGGKMEDYLKLSKWCYDNIEQDLANGLMPRWHDETALNKYLLDNPPDVILTPSYHYPQGNIEVYKQEWLPKTFSPKILLLDKNHDEIRR